MLFNSYGFILLFLPFAIICYFGLNRLNIALGKVALLILSILFVGIQSPYHAIIAALSVLMNYGFYRLLSLPALLKYKKVFLIVGITFNIAGLSVFKYASDFALSWPLPLGISFYTFQQIAFLTDCYRGEVGNTTLEDHALFTLFFPKITQGPISYAHELIPSLGDISLKKFSFDNFSKGVYLFSIGLAKKVMIADKFAIFVDYGYSNITSLNSYESLFTILSYTFQLYFDFSGYSDMAVGVGYMFNIELPSNFNSPYKAKNISDFWKRWHITLTRFLTKYIYIPLGGNRCGTLRTFVNILIVYLVSGLWHGTGCNFLIWGLMHGVASILYRILKKQFDSLPSFFQWGLTFVFINITWVFFRANSVDSAIQLLQQVVIGGWTFDINAALTESLLQPTFISVFSQILSFKATILLSFASALLLVTVSKNSNEKSHEFHASVSNLLITYFLLVISILSLSGVSSFLYTNF